MFLKLMCLQFLFFSLRNLPNPSSIAMKIGVVGVPSMYMFHNHKLVTRYNGSEFVLPDLVDFIQLTTTLKPVDEVALLPDDYLGPLVIDPSTQNIYTNRTIAWGFCVGALLFLFLRTSLFGRIKQAVRNQWNDHLHAHID